MSTYAYKELSELNSNELFAYAKELQLRISRFSSVEQQLINIRDRLDSEVMIHKQMNAFNERAFKVADPNLFFQLVAESVVDIFEFQFGMAILYHSGEPEKNLFRAEGVVIPPLAVNCMTEVFATRFGQAPNKRVQQFKKDDWPELSGIIPFHQFILVNQFNPETQTGIFIAGGILDKGAMNFKEIEDQRAEAFELFAKQVLSHFNSHEKTLKIARSEKRLSALANTFVGFGSIPLDNIISITRLALNILNADFVFYRSADRINPIVFLNEQKNNSQLFLADRGMSLLYEQIMASPDEMVLTTQGVLEEYEILSDHDTKNAGLVTIGHKIRLEGQMTGLLCVGFANHYRETQEDLQVIGIIGSALAMEEKRHLVRQNLLTNNAELKKINAELDNFVYSVSHDLRTPLLAIKGLIKLIDLDDGELSENREFFHLIEGSADRMDNSIIEILDYSRNARLSMGHEQIALLKMVKDAYADVRYYSDHLVSLVLEIEENLNFLSDKYRLNTVIKNIIGNAVKYADEGKPDSFVKVRAWRSENELQMEISDNGIGIEEDNLEKVFHMFFRASMKTTGTGLGLYIAKEIMNKLEGDIFIASELGKGTSIKMVLPVEFVKP